MTLTFAKWTIDEYHRMIETGLLDDRHVELLRGKIVEMSPEGEAHAYFSSEAEEYLRKSLGDKPYGHGFAYCATIRSGKPITLPDNSEPELRNAVNAGTRIEFECTVDQILQSFTNWDENI